MLYSKLTSQDDVYVLYTVFIPILAVYSKLTSQDDVYVLYTVFIPILAVYSKLTSQDDAGAMINDKEDGLWNPRVELSSSMGGVSAQGGGRKKNRAQRYREMKRQSGVVNPRRRKPRKYKVTATAINFAFIDMFRMITIISPNESTNCLKAPTDRAK